MLFPVQIKSRVKRKNDGTIKYIIQQKTLWEIKTENLSSYGFENIEHKKLY